MYEIVRNSGYKSKQIDTPIVGGGYFSGGIYSTTINAEPDLSRDGIVVYFHAITGNYHKQAMKFSSWPWISLRAALFPNLAMQKKIDELEENNELEELAELISNIRVTIEVELGRGYQIKRSKGLYCATVGNEPIINWTSNLNSVIVEARKRGLKRAYHVVVNIVREDM